MHVHLPETCNQPVLKLFGSEVNCGAFVFHMYKPLVVIAEPWHNFPMGNKSYYVLCYNDTMKACLICGDCTSNNWLLLLPLSMCCE